MHPHARIPDPLGSLPPLPIPVVPMPGDRWEYRRLERNLRTEEAPTEKDLDALGREGWELVGMFFDSPLLYLYLKRLA